MAYTVCSLADVPDDFGSNYLKCDLSLRKKQKALAFITGCYIEKVKFMTNNDGIIRLHGAVHPSVRKSDSAHVVDIDVNVTEKRVVDAYCKCKQVINGTCSHILAIIYAIEQWKIVGYKDVPAMLTSTSLPQQWDKPRGSKIRPEPVSRMVIARPLSASRKRKPVMAEFTDNRNIPVTNDHIAILKKLKSSPISYLLEETTSETTYMDTPIGLQVVGSMLSYHGDLMDNVYEPRTELGCGNLRLPIPVMIDADINNFLSDNKYLWSELDMSQEQCIKIEKETKMQNLSQEWYKHRKPRITASVFGAIMNRKKKVNHSFLKNTFLQKPFVAKQTTYGQVHERTAKLLYMNKTGSHMHDVGLVINSQFPFLGASPDALVCSNGTTGIVEVKCPYSIRTMTVHEAVEKKVKNFCLVQNGDVLELSKVHNYFYQIQGQLLVTGMPFCEFIVFSNADIFVQRIMPDNEVMQSILKKMADFYISDFKPFILL